MKKILDEFSHLKVSRQRKYQLRMAKRDCCQICGCQSISKTLALCAEHLRAHRIRARERARKKHGFIKRYLTSISYQP